MAGAIPLTRSLPVLALALIFGGFVYDLLKARAELLPATAEISGASSTTTHLHAVDNAVKTGLVSARLTPLPPGSTCLDGHPDCASNAGILTPALLALLLVTLFTALLGILTVGFAPRRRAFGQVFVLVSIVVAFYAITRTALAQATGLQAVSTLTSTTTWFGTTTTTVTIADLQSSVATPHWQVQQELQTDLTSMLMHPRSIASSPWWLIGGFIAFYACWASGAIYGVIPGTRMATSPSETGRMTARSTSVLQPVDESEARQIHPDELPDVAPFSPIALKPDDGPRVNENQTAPVVKPIAGPSQGVARMAILLALIIFAGILLPVGFAEPTSPEPPPYMPYRSGFTSNPSSGFSAWALPFLLASWLLLPTLAYAQIPNVVVPARVTTTVAGGSVYTISLCNFQQPTEAMRSPENSTDKRWVPLTCGAVSRPSMSFSKLGAFALFLTMLVVPVFAVEQATVSTQASDCPSTYLGVSTAMAEAQPISIDWQAQSPVSQPSPAVVTIYSTTHVNRSSCTGLNDLQDCPDKPPTVPKNEARHAGWAAATITLWVITASLAAAMAFLLGSEGENSGTG